MLLTLGALTTFAWVTASAVMASRGLDITDEGFYLLSYRWWETRPENFTGAQYIYGPVYQALGWQVAELRLFRVGTLIVVHAALGLAAHAWIRDTSAGGTTLSRGPVVSMILAAGGLSLAWGPLSPGYNDLTLLSSLVLTTCVLELHRRSVQRRHLSWWTAPLMGAAGVTLVLAKWSAAVVTLPLVLLCVGLCTLTAGKLDRLRWCAMLTLSTVAAVASLHLTVGPLPRVVEPMIRINQELSGGSNSPTGILSLYAASTGRILLAAAVPVALGALVLFVGRVVPAAAEVSALSAPVVSCGAAVLLIGGVRGGVTGVFGYVVALVAITSVVVLVVLLERRWSRTDKVPGLAALTALLLLLPGVQSLGTGNPLYFLAVNGYVLWLVLVIRCATGSYSAASRLAAMSAAATATVIIGWVVSDGILQHPYRTGEYSRSTVPVTSASTGRLSLPPEVADQVKALQSAIPSQPGIRVMAFDEMAGLVLLLDGQSVGESWYSALDPGRTAESVGRECASAGNAVDGHLLLIFNRAPTSTDRETVAACGLDLDRDFRTQQIPGPYDLTVYLAREAQP